MTKCTWIDGREKKHGYLLGFVIAKRAWYSRYGSPFPIVEEDRLEAVVCGLDGGTPIPVAVIEHSLSVEVE